MTVVFRAYKITCIKSGKSYIGITRKTLTERWKRHCAWAALGYEYPLSRAIRKYGQDNFEVIEVGVAYTADEAGRLECGLIAALGTLAPGGYNATVGGETFGRGIGVSEETSRKLSESITAAFADPEVRKKRSEQRKKEWANPEYRAKMKILRGSPEAREKYRQAARTRAARQKRERDAAEKAFIALRDSAIKH